MPAYSYVKLGVYYKDEGATYSFVKKTFPRPPLAASLIGWWVIFGYISTLALYAYTFSAYAISSSAFADNEWARKAVAGLIIAVFTLINIWSVKGMGKLEDLMVYTKLFILVIISVILINAGETSLPTLIRDSDGASLINILIVGSITFVAYEGFQLVIMRSMKWNVTFLLVSFLMAYTNHKIRKKTGSSPEITLLALTGLATGTALILYFEATTQPEQLLFIGGLYAALLTAGSWGYARANTASAAAETQYRHRP